MKRRTRPAENWQCTSVGLLSRAATATVAATGGPAAIRVDSYEARIGVEHQTKGYA